MGEPHSLECLTRVYTPVVCTRSPICVPAWGSARFLSQPCTCADLQCFTFDASWPNGARTALTLPPSALMSITMLFIHVCSERAIGAAADQQAGCRRQRPLLQALPKDACLAVRHGRHDLHKPLHARGRWLSPHPPPPHPPFVFLLFVVFKLLFTQTAACSWYVAVPPVCVPSLCRVQVTSTSLHKPVRARGLWLLPPRLCSFSFLSCPSHFSTQTAACLRYVAVPPFVSVYSLFSLFQRHLSGCAARTPRHAQTTACSRYGSMSLVYARFLFWLSVSRMTCLCLERRESFFPEPLASNRLVHHPRRGSLQAARAYGHNNLED